jgi:hypothetical protein
MAGAPPRPGFGDDFRGGIHLAMEMGAPPDAENQATFTFPSQLVYDSEEGAVDATGVPFDAEIPVRNRPRPSVTGVPCAVEYFDERGQATNFGSIHATRVLVTLLDEDFRKVEGCNAVILGGDKYLFRRMEPPSGLFDVGLFQLWFHAEDER